MSSRARHVTLLIFLRLEQSYVECYDTEVDSGLPVTQGPAHGDAPDARLEKWMNRILRMLSMANFIAAGVLFLLGSLQSEVPPETSAAGAGVAMESSQRAVLDEQGGPSPAEAAERTEPQAISGAELTSSPSSTDQQIGRSGSMTGSQAGNKTEIEAESQLATAQDREIETMSEPIGQHLEATASVMRLESANATVPSREDPEVKTDGALSYAAPTVNQDSTDSTQALTVQADPEHLEESFIISEESYSPGAFLLGGDALRRIDLIASRAVEGKYRIVVEGHADAVPVASSQRVNYSSNQELSLLRATVVADRLVASGIDRSRITVLGHGDSRPVASNLTPEGRALNRRVEVQLVPEHGPAMVKVSTPASAERKTGD
ncbi:MAG: OmpA family protein [Desulfocurvibacter africanus]